MTSFQSDSGKSVLNVENTVNDQIHAIGERKLMETDLPENEKRQRIALLESEQRFLSIFENSPLGMSITSIDGSLQVNQAFCDMLGYSHDDLVNKNWREISHQDDEQSTTEIITDLLSGKLEKACFEKRYIPKSGEIIYAEVSTFLQRDSNGMPLYFITSVNNITRRKKAEQEQFRLLNIIENSLDEIYIFDAETLKFEHLNKGALDNIGYTPDEIKLLTPVNIKPEFDEITFRQTIEPLLSGKEQKLVFETVHRRKNGSIYPVEVHLQLDGQGDRPLFFAIINDITTRKAKQSELQHTFQKLNFHIENSPMAVIEFNAQYEIIYWSGNAEKIFGWKAEEVVGKSIETIKWVHEEDVELIAELSAEMFAGKKTSNLHVNRNYTKNGEIRTCEWYNSAFYDLDGKLVSMQSLVLDITKRKDSEEKLIQSEEKFRNLTESTPISICIYQDNQWVYTNPSGEELSGYSFDEFCRLKIWQIVAPEYQDLIMQKTVQRLAGKGSHQGYEFRIIRKNGESRWVYLKGSLITLNGHPAGLISLLDITERKEAEAAITDANQKMDAFFNQSLDGFFFMMLDEPIAWNEEADKEKLLDYVFSHQRITKINQAMLDQYGVTEQDFKNITPADFFANNRRHGKELLRRLFDEGKLHRITDERRLNGEPIVIEGDYICLYDSDGRITGHFGIQRDITESRHAENALKESEMKFKTLVESSADGISLLDLHGNILFANQRKAEMVGVKSYADLIGLNTYSLIAPQYHSKFRELSSQFLATGQLKNIETEIVRRDGTTFWAEINLSLVPDSNGTPSYIMDSMRDISERKKSEEILLRSERELKRAQQVAHVGNWVWDIKKNSLEWSDEMYRIFGVNKEEFTGNLSEIVLLRIHPDDQEKVLKSNLAVINEAKPIPLEYRVVWPDHSVHTVWAEAGNIELDKDGKAHFLRGIVQDITDRKKAETQIIKLTKSIEQSPSTIVITDINGNIEYVNPKFTEITGYSPEEAIGKNPNILKSGKMPEEVYQQVWEALRNGEVWRGEFLNRKKNGDLYWEWATMTSIKNDKGEITNYIAIKEDISLRKQMEADLIIAKERAEESERIFKSYFNSNPAATFVWKYADNDFLLIDVNETANKLTNNKAKHFIGLKASVIYPDLPYIIEKLHECFHSKKVIEFEYHYKARYSNEFEWIKFVLAYHEPDTILFFTETITSKKLVEIELIQAKERAEESEKILTIQKQDIELNNNRMESLLRITQVKTNSIQELLDFALNEAVNLTDSKIGYIYYYNDSSKQFTLNTWSKGVMKECAVQKPETIYDLESTGCWGEAVRQKKPIIINDYEADNPLKRGIPSGHVQLKKFLTIPVIFENKIVAVAGVANKELDYNNADVRQLSLLMDSVWKISERIQLIKDLTVSKERAEESDRLKSAFLANMSHEIRTPLNSIIGFSELLGDSDYGEELKKNFLSHIVTNGNNLLNIISDIVDISKIESGEIIIRTSNFQVAQFLDELRVMYEFQAKEKQLSLKCYYPGADITTPITVTADKERLYQIFNNLIGNALKFTSEGYIEVGCRLSGEMIEFYVKDTGIGIPPNYHEKIFDRFRQVEASYTRKYGGNGLGLSISKKLIELMGGKIWIESELGHGATFYFTLPLSKI